MTKASSMDSHQAAIISFEADDPSTLLVLIKEVGLEDQVLRAKALEQVVPILIALGGGVGIGATICSIGVALQRYFGGRSEYARAETGRVRVKIGAATIDVTARNVDTVTANVLEALKSAGYHIGS